MIQIECPYSHTLQEWQESNLKKINQKLHFLTASKNLEDELEKLKNKPTSPNLERQLFYNSEVN